MRRAVTKLKPTSGFAHVLHLALYIILPILVFVLVRIDFVPLAYVFIVLSKWRMLAVKPRYWLANIRANAIDMMVGFSFVTFIAQAPTQSWQLIWAVAYGIWLVFIKPRSGTFWVSMQALIGQMLSLIAVYLIWSKAPLLGLVLLTGLVCYLSARHFLSTFDEPLSSLLAYVWGYFGAGLTWTLGHWLLFYGTITQPTLLIAVLTVGIGALYYLDRSDRLSTLARREIIIIMSAVILFIIVFSDWSDKAI